MTRNRLRARTRSEHPELASPPEIPLNSIGRAFEPMGDFPNRDSGLSHLDDRFDRGASLGLPPRPAVLREPQTAISRFLRPSHSVCNLLVAHAGLNHSSD